MGGVLTQTVSVFQISSEQHNEVTKLSSDEGAFLLNDEHQYCHLFDCAVVAFLPRNVVDLLRQRAQYDSKQTAKVCPLM